MKSLLCCAFLALSLVMAPRSEARIVVAPAAPIRAHINAFLLADTLNQYGQELRDLNHTVSVRISDIDTNVTERIDLIEWALLLFGSLLTIISFLGVRSFTSYINGIFIKKIQEVLSQDNVDAMIHKKFVQMTKSFDDKFNEFFQVAEVKMNALHQYAFGNYQEAYNLFRELESLTGGGSRVDKNHLALLSAKLGLADEAERRYKELISNNPTAIDVINYADFVCDSTKDRQCTLAIYENALKGGMKDSCVMANYIETRLLFDHSDPLKTKNDLAALNSILSSLNPDKSSTDKMAAIEIYFVSAVYSWDAARSDGRLCSLIDMLQHGGGSLYWNFDKHLQVAISIRHANMEALTLLAQVARNRAPDAALQQLKASIGCS